MDDNWSKYLIKSNVTLESFKTLSNFYKALLLVDPILMETSYKDDDVMLKCFDGNICLFGNYKQGSKKYKNLSNFI